MVHRLRNDKNILIFYKKLEGFTWSLALLKTNALDKYAQGAYLLSKLHIKGGGLFIWKKYFVSNDITQ